MSVESDDQDLLGNAFLQSRLAPECETQDGPLETDQDAVDEDLLEFMKQRFSVKDNVPSTGFGCFDADYDPQSSVLSITLRLAFEFALTDDPTWFDGPNDVEWSDAEKQSWKDAFISTVQSAWGTEHSIRCVRPGWCVEAQPILRIVEVPAGDAHYTLTVHRNTNQLQPNPRPRVHESTGLFGTTRTATQYEDSTDVGIDDPGVLESEIARVNAFTAEPFRFDVEGEEVELVDGGAQRAAAIASELRARPPDTPRLDVWVMGWDDADGGRASRAATEDIVGRMPKAPHSFRGFTVEPNPRGEVTFKANESPDSYTAPDHFEYSAHETGHMLGLPDEYEGSSGTYTPEQLASYDALIESAGAERELRDADTSTIMSKGGDVMPAHLVTMWEALGRMTCAFLAPTEWKV